MTYVLLQFRRIGTLPSMLVSPRREATPGEAVHYGSFIHLGLYVMRSLIITLFMLLGSLAASSRADDAKQTFDTLFGQKLKQVKATSHRADDTALAEQLIEAAKQATDTPRLVVILCNTAHDLTRSHEPSVALRAMRRLETLAETLPEKLSDSEREAVHAKLIVLLTTLSRTGDPDARDAAVKSLIARHAQAGDAAYQANKLNEATASYRKAMVLMARRNPAAVDSFREKIKLATTRARAVRRVEQLEQALLRDATDHATLQELILTYLLDLQQPNNAARYVSRVTDAELKANLQLAVRDVNELNAGDCLKRGEWYAAAMADGNGPREQAAGNAAMRSFRRSLKLGPPDHLSRTKAEIMLKQIATKVNASDAIAEPMPAINRKGLLIRYVFDERYVNNGSLKNLAGNKWHGKVNGGTWTKSEAGPAIAFSASGHSIDTGFKETLKQWSFAAWVAGNHVPGKSSKSSSGPIHRENVFQITWRHPESRFVGVIATEVKGAWFKIPLGKIEAKTWYHVAATYDGKTMRGYVNGRLVGERTWRDEFVATCIHTLKLGCHARDPDKVWSGAIAQFFLYSRPLSAKEIAALAKPGK